MKFNKRFFVELHLFYLKPLWFIAILFKAILAFSQEKSSKIITIPQEKQIIENGICIYFTPRGLNFFENNLPNFLANFGFSPHYAFFPSYYWLGKKTLNLDDLNFLDDSQKKQMIQIHQHLMSWFPYLPQLKFRPEIHFNNLIIEANYKKFGLILNPSIVQKYKKKPQDVIGVIQIETNSLNISLQRITLQDHSQKDLGALGFVNPRVSTGPFRLNIPFRIQMNYDGYLEFEVLSSIIQIEQTPFQFTYQKIIHPSVTITIGNRTINMNSQKLEEYVKSQIPFFIERLKSYLVKQANQDLTHHLNQVSKKYFKKSMNELNVLIPPGSSEFSENIIPFYWGILPKRIYQKDGLWITFNTFIEDPSAHPTIPLNPSSLASNNYPQGKGLNRSEYDLFIGLSRSFINRTLQLSFHRGYMSILKSKITDRELILLEPLTVDGIDPITTPSNSHHTSTLMRIRIMARVKPGTVQGFQEVFLKDQFQIFFYVTAKLKNSPQGVVIELGNIDLNSLWVPRQDLTLAGKIFKSQVFEKIKKELKELNTYWAHHPELFPGNLPLPPKLFGIDFNMIKIDFEKTGHLVMYLRYK